MGVRILPWIGPLLAGRIAGMTTPAISRYPVPSLDTLPEDHAHELPDVRWSALQDLLHPRTTEEK